MRSVSHPRDPRLDRAARRADLGRRGPARPRRGRRGGVAPAARPRLRLLLEIPPLRVPSLGNILVKTAARTEWYLKEAVPLFVLGTLLLWARDAPALLPRIESAARALVVGLLGLPERATEALLIGFLRRDYGAAGFLMLRNQGLLDGVQAVVSLVVITLFVPCIANFFMMVKERGVAVAAAQVAFIVPTAFLVGGALNWLLRTLGVTL